MHTEHCKSALGGVLSVADLRQVEHRTPTLARSSAHTSGRVERIVWPGCADRVQISTWFGRSESV